MIAIYKKLRRSITGKPLEEGASLTEYALLVGLIAVVCIAAITLLGTNISELFNRIAGKLTGIGT